MTHPSHTNWHYAVPALHVQSTAESIAMSHDSKIKVVEESDMKNELEFTSKDECAPQQIHVRGSGPSLQPTYNAAAGGNSWNFGSGGFCSGGDMFTIRVLPSADVAIKAGDAERYLSITVDGEGVPANHPTFTSSNPRGNSLARITGFSVTLTRFAKMDDGSGSGFTSLGFTVEVNGCQTKFCFVPGTYQIVVMQTDEPQFLFRVF